MSYTIDDFELLNDTGFAFEQIGLKAARLSANFGDGYTASARIGSREGLRAWRVKIEALPNAGHYIGQETRARYLWEFWRRHKLERNSEVFLMRDPFPPDPARPYVFARFTEDELDFGMLCESVFNAGLAVVQARVPYLDPNTFGQQQI